ncbi:hypothetical protein L195_g019436 [Trifolium pratense]|uniref:Uncharacterized protein n=1 Tax=Trifolium pratense TaxID=57577 RepID=A0A2K3MZN5_TRIPR|nr:hypothetical protein L195_g019436 [Trifolium pratense]
MSDSIAENIAALLSKRKKKLIIKTEGQLRVATALKTTLSLRFQMKAQIHLFLKQEAEEKSITRLRYQYM